MIGFIIYIVVTLVCVCMLIDQKINDDYWFW